MCIYLFVSLCVYRSEMNHGNVSDEKVFEAVRIFDFTVSEDTRSLLRKLRLIFMEIGAIFVHSPMPTDLESIMERFLMEKPSRLLELLVLQLAKTYVTNFGELISIFIGIDTYVST